MLIQLIDPILSNTANGPYANHMNVQLQYEIVHGQSVFDEWLCDLIVDGLTALAMYYAPELAGADIWQDIELQAMCAWMGEQIGSRDVNVTGNALSLDPR